MATDSPVTVLELSRKDHGRIISTDEFYHADFDGPWVYEREDGRLLVMSPEGTKHVRRSNSWRDRLVLYKYNNPGVIEEVVNQAWVRPDDLTDRMGDIGVYLVHEGRELAIPEGPPDLMFEIVSPGKTSRERDYVKKRAEYQKLGIREYVIIDRRPAKVTVLTLGAEGYSENVLTEADTYTSPFLPGFAVRLSEVL